MLRRPLDDLVLRNFVLPEAVPTGLEVPDETPDELPSDRADNDPPLIWLVPLVGVDLID